MIEFLWWKLLEVFWYIQHIFWVICVSFFSETLSEWDMVEFVWWKFYFRVRLLLFPTTIDMLHKNEYSWRCRAHYNYSNNGVVALVLARGGSKGIRLKNLAKIGTDTLLGRTLKTIYRSKTFVDVWVSTDHDEIAVEAMQCNIMTMIRPLETAETRLLKLRNISQWMQTFTSDRFI